MMNYLKNIYGSNLKQINEENMELFIKNRNLFRHISKIILKPKAAYWLYLDAVEIGYEPLILAAEETLERSVYEVQLSISEYLGIEVGILYSDFSIL